MEQILLLIFIPLLRATDIELFTADDKQYVELSPYCITAANRSAFSFQVLAKDNAHVALMSTDNTAGPLYEIVIGGWGNKVSCIRSETVNQTKLIEFTHTNPYPVNFLAVMTGFGSTGNWKFINDVTCNLEAFENTRVIINNTECNGITTYDCEHGYYLVQGNLQRTCLTGRTWSGIPPVCEQITCNLEVYENTKVIINNTIYNGITTYECEHDYYLVQGNLQRTCLTGRTWSGIPPVCERCMCPCSMQNQRFYNSSEELYQRIQELRKILKVEKNSTNAYLRKKISVPDSRPSSVGIGNICGYGVIIVLVTLLVISDAPILYRQIRFGTN
uniref:Sushi domain-containing protein n=1 Tax=Magallana gigas TaxID=29159 RepID=A0A8W8LAY1_MAGGI